MPYNLPDPLDENALKQMQRDKRYWRDPDMQRAVEAGYRLLYPNRGRDAFGRLIIGVPRRGSLADLRRLAASEQTSDNILDDASWGGPVHVDAYTRNGDEPVRQHYRGLPVGGDGNVNAKQRPPSVSEENWQRYRPIFESGLVDIEGNAARATRTDIWSFVTAATDRKQWDFKHNDEMKELVEKGAFTSDQLQDFGNYHFGHMAYAFGFDLAKTLAGGGAYQAFWQGGGDKAEALLGLFGAMSSNDTAAMATDMGFSWGDNHGDADAVMRGWLDRQRVQEGLR